MTISIHLSDPVYPHSNALSPIFPLKLQHFAPTASAVSYVKPEVSQRKATLHNDVWFPTVNHRIYSGWLPSGRNKIPWLFPDQIQFFTDQNTVVLRPICLLAADKWQIPFTSSLKCTSLILEMKQIKSLNSFLAQNVLKLTSFHSFERAREKINTFQVVKIPATTHILGQNYEIPWLFPNFLGILNFPDQSAKFPDVSLTLKKNQISLTFPWPVATLLLSQIFDIIQSDVIGFASALQWAFIFFFSS